MKIMDRAADIAKSLRRAAKRVLVPAGGFERPKKGKGSYTRKRKHRKEAS
jgi:hypothetical protein